MIAAVSGHDDIIDILMEAGADIDVQTVKLKLTALIMAIRSVDPALTIENPDNTWRAERIALKLIYANADIHLRESNGQSALDHASQSKLK
jgi:ankyrin repeat protein